MQSNEETTLEQQIPDQGDAAASAPVTPASTAGKKAVRKKASKKKTSRKKVSKKKVSKKKVSKKKVSKKKVSKKKVSKKKVSKKKASKKKASKKKASKKKASKKKASKKKASKKKASRKKAARKTEDVIGTDVARILAAADEQRDAIYDLVAHLTGEPRQFIEELRSAARSGFAELEAAARRTLDRLIGKD